MILTNMSTFLKKKKNEFLTLISIESNTHMSHLRKEKGEMVKNNKLFLIKGSKSSSLFFKC